MSASTWRLAHREVDLRAPVLMAILNVTPDSFSDGGKLLTPEAIARAARTALDQGAQILDVGGESTRPGAQRVPAKEQIRRVVPAIELIRRELGSRPILSVDTTRAEVAASALDAGAEIVNDVSAGTEDPALFPLCAARHAGLVLMHRLRLPGEDAYSDRYPQAPAYADVVEEVRAFLQSRMNEAIGAGVPAQAIVLDPGLGFGKTVEQNLALIRGTPRLLELGRPILSGLSRKSFTARAAGMGPDTLPETRTSGTIGLSVAHVAAGARVLRLHDVGPARAAFAAYSGASQEQPAA